MKVYRIIHKNYEGDVVFGLPYPYNESLSEKKINLLFGNMEPWTQSIPYYSKSKFAFISLDALLTFLMFENNFNNEEYEDFLNNFIIESFELNTWSSGLSKFLCTYFDDEVEEGTNEIIDINNLIDSTFKFIYQNPIPDFEIDFCKESYYKNVKTFYKN